MKKDMIRKAKWDAARMFNGENSEARDEDFEEPI